VPLPARAHQSFGLFTVRLRGRAAQLPVRGLNAVPATMRAAVAISPATTSGRITTFTVLVAIDDLRAARTLTSEAAPRTLDLEVGSMTHPALSQRGVIATCPQSRFAVLVKQARTGFALGTGKGQWRRIALDAVAHATRWCSTDPLVQSQTFVGFESVDVTTARLNADATPDLVVLQRPHALRGYIGTNNGTFRPSFTLELPAVTSPTSVVAVAEPSGRSDFYVTDSSGPVQFVDDQGGVFRVSSMPFSAIDGAAGSFDGVGGSNDVAFVDGRTSSFSVVLDEGAVATTVAADTVPSHVATGDFNGDGDVDLAGAGPAGVAIATGDGSGSFNPRGLPVQQPNLSTAIAAAPAGAIPDLIVGTTAGALVVDFSSDLSYSATSLQAGTAPAAVALADVAGDARLDALALDRPAAAVNVWVATPNAYRAPVAIAAQGRPTAFAFGRFNADTRTDVAVATEKGLTILLGRRVG
jgi:hypothetical protein